MHNARSNRGTALKTVAIVAAVALLLGIAILLISGWERRFGEFDDYEKRLDAKLTYNGKEYVLKDGVETFLVLGLDKFSGEGNESYNNDKQADLLLLFVIDNKAKRCDVIHINRDTMAEINILGVAGDKVGTLTGQIALSHTYGNGKEVSCRNAANAVSNVLMGVEVDHYASITMDAVSVLNDLVGGVTLQVIDDLTSVDASLVKGETVTLKGEQALLYVRARHGLEEPTNSARMRRQKQYLEALYESARALEAEDDSAISRAAIEMSRYIVSDCSGNKLESLMEKLVEYELGEILSLDGETVMGEKYLEFYPSEESVKAIVVDCFYKEKH